MVSFGMTHYLDVEVGATILPLDLDQDVIDGLLFLDEILVLRSGIEINPNLKSDMISLLGIQLVDGSNAIDLNSL